MGFPRQEYWSELPFPSPGKLLDPRIEPSALAGVATAYNEASISWTAGDPGDDAWQISYKTGAGEWSSPAGVTTNPYTLTGLTENTTYDVRVRTNCGDGEENKSEWTATVTFTTPCEAITVDGDHPYAVDMRASTIADCWSQTDGTYLWSFSSTNGATFSTSSYSEQTSTKLVSPLFDFGAGDYWMNFTGKLYGGEDYYGYSEYTATLKVYYRTSPSGAWQELAGQSYSATGETENLNVEEVMLPAGTCQLAFEATTDYSSSYAYTYLYSFAVEKVPSCFQPRNLTHSDVAARTATVTWERHPMGTEGAWDLQLATNNTFTEGVQNIVVNTTPSKALTGLTPETHYFVRVKPACDDAGLLWSSVDDFTTLAACLVPTALTVDDITAHTAEISWTGASDSYNVQYRTAAYTSPLDEDFTGLASGIPAGWDNSEGTTTYESYKWSYYNGGHDAAPCLRFNSYSNSINNTNFLKTPTMDFDGGNTMVLSFWWKNPTGGDFSVYISTDGGTTKTELATGLTGQSSWTQEVINLTGYEGASNVTIHFKGTSNYGSGDAYIYLDEVKVGIEVPAGEWQHVTSTTETKQLTGLLASTLYEVKVQGDCSASGDGLSEWSAIASFTTDIPCATPTALAAPVSGVKARQVDLTWTSYAEDWQLDVYDQTRGESFGFFDVNIGDVVQEGNNMTYTLDNLEPETEYIVRLRSNCEASYAGDGQSEWSALLNVTTLEDCSTPTSVTASDITNNSATISWTGDSEFTLRYRVAAGISPLLTEGFESGIGAWSLVNCHASTNIISSANHSGSNGFRFYYSSNPPQYLVSPELTGVIEGTKLEFYYKNYSSSYSETFHVGTSTVAAANASEIETNFAFGGEITADDQQWHLYSATIPAGTKYICIKYTSDNQFYLYIDDILIGTPTTAGAWTEVNVGTATNYVIPTTPGLAAETKYEVQVEALCGGPHPVSDAYFFTTQAGITKNIVADQWYAISSPVHNSGDDEAVAGVTNLIPTAPVEYDLLRYNESAGRWESQKAGVAPFTTLERGRGYIYRRSTAATLTFVGQRNTGAVNRSITNSCGDVNIKGFNLIGNPYDAAYAPTRAFYTLQANGTWMVHTASPSNKVAAGEGFFIYDNSNATSYVFAEPSGAKGAPRSNAAAIAFTVSNDDYSDIAYARFADGEGMPKMAHLNSEAPALSIPQGDRRYAIANLDENTESFPLHFSGFGEYTFSLSDNSLGLGYLHLIDRETGADVDMLRQSGYTFNANGNESERFVVLLRPTADANSFVRVSDSRLIVDGEGELQVFDVMGRQLGSAQVAGTATLDRSALGIVSAGVYVMRLGGNSQKIVVK